MTGWRRYLADVVVVVLTAAALLAGWTLWGDHQLLHQLARIEMQRQQRERPPAALPARPPQ